MVLTWVLPTASSLDILMPSFEECVIHHVLLRTLGFLIKQVTLKGLHS